MKNKEINQECPNDMDLFNYCAGAIDVDRNSMVEKHLMCCDHCLKEIMFFKRSLRAMTAGKNISIPEELKEKIVRLAAEKKGKGLISEKATEYILSLTERGIKFLRTNLVPEGIEVNISRNLIPAHAFRNNPEDKEESINIEQKVENIDVRIQIARLEGTRSTMNVFIMKDNIPLKKTRVTLYTDNRILLSRITSNNGNAEFPDIALGDYIIKIPNEEIEMKFRILPHRT